jgi:hypothetical protein
MAIVIPVARNDENSCSRPEDVDVVRRATAEVVVAALAPEPP